jgi:uncharacterized protein (TIGR02453 family)
MASSNKAFPGFPVEMVEFFKGLEKNNNRDWFQPRKSIYEEKVKAPMIDLVTAVNEAMLKFAPDNIVDPAKAIYRIYRDTRFSKDKTPYKTHIGAIFPRRGMDRHGSGGYYFGVSHKEIEIAGGLYMPSPEQLKLIRGTLAERHREFTKLAGAKKVVELVGKLGGETLSRVPKGYPADHPAADLIRMKHWVYFATLPPASATTPGIVKEIVDRFKAMAPVVDFFNEPLLQAHKKAIKAQSFTT